MRVFGNKFHIINVLRNLFPWKYFQKIFALTKLCGTTLPKLEIGNGEIKSQLIIYKLISKPDENDANVIIDRTFLRFVFRWSYKGCGK